MSFEYNLPYTYPICYTQPICSTVMRELLRKTSDDVQLYNESFKSLPYIIEIAKTWIHQRPTIKSVYETEDNPLVLTHHFRRVYDIYVVGAQDEAEELCNAYGRDDEIDELGDTIFQLLHFFNAAGLEIEDLARISNYQIKNDETNSDLSHASRNTLVGNKKSVLEAVKTMRSYIYRSHINLLGPMPFGDDRGDAPWVNHKTSHEWKKFKQEAASYWFTAFMSALKYSQQLGVNSIELVENTASKASYNFPRPFFDQDYSWFSGEPNGDKYDVKCCRLLRKVYIDWNYSYLDLFHDVQKSIVFTPDLFRHFVYGCLNQIGNLDDDCGYEAVSILGMINYLQNEKNIITTNPVVQY